MEKIRDKSEMTDTEILDSLKGCFVIFELPQEKDNLVELLTKHKLIIEELEQKHPCIETKKHEVVVDTMLKMIPNGTHEEIEKELWALREETNCSVKENHLFEAWNYTTALIIESLFLNANDCISVESVIKYTAELLRDKYCVLHKTKVVGN